MDFVANGHGMRMPKLGFGTWRLKGADGQAAVESALALGYRHIDTAQMYGNEDAVGAALVASGIGRDALHVTTKVWHENLAPDRIRAAMADSLAALRLDHVDLYLIHWPSPRMDLAAALETLVALKEAGMTRHIGVANFTVPLLRRAIEEIGAPIVCNQIEYHVLLDQTKVIDYARGKGLTITAYCPLAQGRVSDQPVLAEIARKHAATPGQIALKWLLDQDGISPIPKAGGRARQQENLDALKITLDDADRAAIAALPKDQRFVNPGFAPAWDKAA
jgi:2,5-diketo-D-gluconate reductase B